ncbi:NPC intracellular cholesterol transporter 1 [Camellia lanceoleosa]|uniref:NPC intracellular cholesterol transporter 1 n=1 Tax=Camellia lanceoleosa TaxID=1840588 RepID=A0ACC0GTY2_9ERIC|nr:NPC intracellular cholesterol transporter 1 [Camellia lanceoleosa]
MGLWVYSVVRSRNGSMGLWVYSVVLHRRCKNRNGSMGLFGCASPRNGRRSRRRFEPEIRGVMDLGIVEEMGKMRLKLRRMREKLETYADDGTQSSSISISLRRLESMDELLPMVQSSNLTLSFSSDSSIEEELKRESIADVVNILISYLVMSAYISVTLGDAPHLSTFYILSKVELHLFSATVSDIEDNDLMQNQPSSLSADATLTNALTKYEKSDDDASIASSNHEHQVSQNSASCFEDNVENNLSGKPGSDMVVFSQAKERVINRKISYKTCRVTMELLFLDDAPPEILSRASRTSVNSEELDDKVKPLVQQKGRFKVTSENVDLEKVGLNPLMQKSHSMRVCTFQVNSVTKSIS